MRVSVIGTGYVGLVTGACLADLGNDVLCSDVDPVKIEALKRGEVPIHEPGLSDVVTRNIAAGRLRFTTDLEASARHGRIQMIAVGTPAGEDGAADLQYVLAAARSIGRHTGDDELVVVVKSTVPVGTADKVRAAVLHELALRGLPTRCRFVSNPEFLKQGAAVEDFMRPDRIIVGADDERAVAAMQALYAPLHRHHKRLVLMDIRSAEMTKYAANAMLATRISLMNELANLAEALGADIDMIRLGIGADPRIGFGFLYAGCGYGGSCFPKDVAALIRTAQDDAGLPLRVLSAVQAANEAQKLRLPDKVKRRFGNDLAGRRFALWGLAFKPDTDDMREAPSRTIVHELVAAGARVRAYDPKAATQARQVFEGIAALEYAPSAMAALADADALIIATEWKEFQSPDFDAIRKALKQPIIFDGRNLYDPAAMRERGFEYRAIGR